MEFRKDKVVMIQAHKWLEQIRQNGTRELLWIGDWAIAERFPCYRGEYVGRTERAQVPYWLYARTLLARPRRQYEKGSAQGSTFSSAMAGRSRPPRDDPGRFQPNALRHRPGGEACRGQG